MPVPKRKLCQEDVHFLKPSARKFACHSSLDSARPYFADWALSTKRIEAERWTVEDVRSRSAGSKFSTTRSVPTANEDRINGTICRYSNAAKIGMRQTK